MDFFLIVLLILLIVAVVLVFKFVKHIVSAILIALFLILAVLCGVAYATYLDVQDIGQHASDKNLLLFEDDSSVIFAVEFVIKTEEGKNLTDSFVFVDKNSFDKTDLNYGELHKTYYKVVEINEKISDTLFADQVVFPFGEGNCTVNMTKEDMRLFMYSDNSIADTVDFMIEKNGGCLNVSDILEFKQNLTQNILSEAKTNDAFKGNLAGIFLATKVKENPASAIKNLISNYKTGNIKVDKKTILFSLLDMAPGAILNGAVNKFSEKMNAGEEQNVAVSKKE